MTPPIAGPCDSPKVVSLSRSPKVFISFTDEYSTAEFYKRGFFTDSVYAEIFYDKNKYKFADSDAKEIYLRKLIYDCIYIRDFYSAGIYISEYLENGYKEGERYSQFWGEVQELLDDVKRQLMRRKSRNIVWSWLDSIRYKDIKHMEYLTSIAKDSAFFENAYTVVPWTSQTYSVLFLEKKPLDDDYSTYRNEKFGYENSRLLACIKESGYSFRRYGDKFYEKYFCTGAETKPPFKDYSELNHPIKGYRICVCTYIFWETLCQIVQEDKPFFVLRHCLCETHYPYISANLTEGYTDSESSMEQFIPSLQYVDMQLKYYDQFLGQNDISVYMSDHGQLGNKYHTLFMIRGQGVKPAKYDSMFSYINFSKLMCRIINENYKWDDLLADYVEIQDVDAYGNRGNISDSGRQVWNRKSIFGYRAVRTRNEMFVRRNDGKEYYYNFPCKYNQVDRSDYNSRVEQLRELTGDKTIDVFKNNFFSKMQIFYKAILFADERNSVWQSSINEKLWELFHDIPKGKKIAFRCGGEHTWELIKIIPDSINVQYIIDRSKDAVTNIPGYQYISPEELSSAGVDVVILSSYIYLKELREEAEQYPVNVSVIDIYKYLENNGIELSKAFCEMDDITLEDIKQVQERT